MSYSGRFVPKNPRKYIGVGTVPIYKSRYELIVFDRLDTDSKVVRWGYEVIEIPYFCKIDNKIHKYKTDIYCEVMKDGQLQKYIIEIKSSEDLNPPSKPTLVNRKSRDRYNFKMRTYIVNMSKWRAAQDFCAKTGFKLIFLTEKDLMS